MTTPYDDEVLEDLTALMIKAAERRYDLAYLLAKAVSRAAQRSGGFDWLANWTTMAYRPKMQDLFELGRDLGESEVRLRRIRSYVEFTDEPLTASAVARLTGIPVDLVAPDLHELWQRGNISVQRENPTAYS